jgi:flagellar biosynthesis protein FlhF
MQVRVFEATDMASGLKMVKNELGPDALILSTRTIRNGKFGLVGKPVFEITAAIDSNFTKKHNGSSAKKVVWQKDSVKERSDATGGFSHVVDDSVEEFLSHPTTFRHADDDSGKGIASYQAATPDDNNDTSCQNKDQRAEQLKIKQQPDLQSDINELKDLLRHLTGKINQVTENEEPAKQPRYLKIQTGDLQNRFDSTAIHGDHILSMLIECGVNVETSRAIAGCLRESLTDQELGDTDNVQAAIKETLEHLIPANPPNFANSKSQQRIALVGPTGVGKTTTLAKIAASYLNKHSNSVALITIDTYRIAAVEQLKVYGEIMHLPVDVVISAEQLEKAIDRHHDKELILIDTAGRSPRDGFCISELAEFLKPELNIDKHLVLSATTREHELLDAIGRFQELGITHTIFTKIDECVNLGILLNVQIQNANPLSYFANGQRVPEDLLEASPKIAAELIMSQKEGSMHD